MGKTKDTKRPKNVVTYNEQGGIQVVEAFPPDAPVARGEGIPLSVTVDELKDVYDVDAFFIELLKALQSRGIVRHSDYQQANAKLIASALRAAFRVDTHNLIAKLGKR